MAKDGTGAPACDRLQRRRRLPPVGRWSAAAALRRAGGLGLPSTGATFRPSCRLLPTRKDAAARASQVASLGQPSCAALPPSGWEGSAGSRGAQKRSAVWRRRRGRPAILPGVASPPALSRRFGRRMRGGGECENNEGWQATAGSTPTAFQFPSLSLLSSAPSRSPASKARSATCRLGHPRFQASQSPPGHRRRQG